MPNIRFIAAGAARCLFSGLAAGSAAAQTATDEHPRQATAIAEDRRATEQAKSTRPHAKTAAVKGPRTHIAKLEHKRPHAHRPAQTAAAPTPAGASAGTPIPPRRRVSRRPNRRRRPSSLRARAPFPSELVVGGQTVQVASPNAVNEIDLAANDKMPPGAAAHQQAWPHACAAASTSQAAMVADAKPRNQTDECRSGGAARSSPSAAPPGSLQVFAALGGAVAAGSVAWFLIGSAPQRTYG